MNHNVTIWCESCAVDRVHKFIYNHNIIGNGRINNMEKKNVIYFPQ